MSRVLEIAKQITEPRIVRQSFGEQAIEWRVRLIGSPAEAAVAASSLGPELLMQLLPSLPGLGSEDPDVAAAKLMEAMHAQGGLAEVARRHAQSAIGIAAAAVDGMRLEGEEEWTVCTLVPAAEEDAANGFIADTILDSATLRAISEAATARIMEARECVARFPGLAGNSGDAAPDGEQLRAAPEHAAGA